MDTKLKNIKYSIGLKITAAIIVWICALGALGNGIFLLYNESNITSKNYYDTHKFRDEFSKLAHNVVELNVVLKSEENIKASGQTDKIIANNLDRLERIKYNLSNTVNFAYFIRNKDTGEVFTNSPTKEYTMLIIEGPNSVSLTQWRPDTYFPLQEDVKQMLLGTPYEAYAAVIEPLKPGDVFYDDFTSYSRVKAYFPYAVALLIASIILMLVAFIYLALVTGRREKGGEIALTYIDRIYTDIFTLLVFIAALISVASVGGISFHNFIGSSILVSFVFSIDVFIGLSYSLSMIRQIKNRQILKNTLIFKIYKYVKDLTRFCFSGKIFKAWTLSLLLGYGLISGILFAIAINGDFSGFLVFMFLLIPFNAAVLRFGAKSLLSLTQIMEAVKEISAGNLDYSLDSSKISPAFSGFAEDIQSLQVGLKKAVDEAVKGERMKTDLITNVSHDLKTPLTSVINYVDLLKKEDLNNAKAREYVGILEEKSSRLKNLIEDLVEASKASSGNLPVNTEKVNLNELVMQACGEYEDKIKKAELDIRVNSGDKKTLILADGKHMWRIVENLLSNALKYSMLHSRVYMDIYKRESYGVLTIKNISAFPLNISPEQLTERFVRGDASRTTEGSGLGLSIAQSLVNLQGGRFNINIDGDLFKVTVEIPLWIEN